MPGPLWFPVIEIASSFHQVLRYLRTVYIVWSLVRRRDAKYTIYALILSISSVIIIIIITCCHSLHIRKQQAIGTSLGKYGMVYIISYVTKSGNRPIEGQNEQALIRRSACCMASDQNIDIFCLHMSV